MSIDLPAASDPANDGLNKPIKSAIDTVPLVDFLSAHPDQRIFMQDLKPEEREGQPTEEEGVLRIGDDGALQVKCGRDWLMVQEHPGRFRLTETSVAAIRADTKKTALAALADCRAPKATAWRTESAAVVRAAPDENPRNVFERNLQRAIAYGRKELCERNKALNVHCQTADEVENLLKQARRIGLTLHLYSTNRDRRRSIRGTEDVHMRYLMNQILPRGFLEDMMYADENHDGPHALLFDTSNNVLIILCKELAMQRQIR